MALTVARHYFYIVQHAYERSGNSFEALCERSRYGKKLGQQCKKGLRMDFKEFDHFMNEAIAELNEPLIGLIAGKYIQPSDYGIHGSIWTNSPNLMDCLAAVSRFIQEMHDAFSNTLEVHGDKLIYYIDMSPLTPEEEQHYINLDISSIYNLGKYLVGVNHEDKVHFEEVSLRQTLSPRDKERYSLALNCPVKDNCRHNSITIDMAVMMLPVRSPDKQIRDMLLKNVESKVVDGVRIDSTAREISNFVSRSLNEGLPTLESAAAHMDMSSSKLKRLLAQEDTSFSKILDQVRYQHACYLLSKPDLPIHEVGRLVGYANASSFTRSFMKWSDMTPQQFRDELT